MEKVKKTVKTYRDLNVYQLSYELAMEIFNLTKGFPKEETYSLTNQIRRASRSISANICEGWAKRKYQNVFLKHLVDSNGSCEEVKVWLDFSRDCEYIKSDKYEILVRQCKEIGAMLHSLIKNWQTF